MVQRKLSLHLHHAQTQTSFPHHHDAAKSPRGADLKAKKMKKSASIKRPKTATPNYMKPTTSSDARKEQSQSQSQSRSPSPSPPSKKRVTMAKKPSFKPARKSADAKTATCSSTLKDSKFPSFLSLNQNGHSAVKVCPYTYCSLNGHHHPPLSSLLSAARRARAPPARADNDDDDDGFFVEIYTAPQDKEERVSEEFSQGEDSFDGSYMDWETGYGYGALLQYDYKAVEIKDELAEDKGCCFDEVLIDEAAQESFDEDGGFNSDAFSSSGDSEISTPLQQQQEEEEEEEEEGNEASSFDDLNQECVPKEEAVAVAVAVEASSKAECNVFENAKDMIALLQFAASSKKVVEEGDELRGFNPRAPNFLAVEAGPEAERVDLRHQDLDERRNSEEWMVDYALRQVVTKLGPAKKRKVALLVEAFERVMPLLLPPRNLDPHLSHASPFDQPRPMQECS